MVKGAANGSPIGRLDSEIPTVKSENMIDNISFCIYFIIISYKMKSISYKMNKIRACGRGNVK